MIIESGRVVAIENDALWVETVRQSSCESCSVQKGCGHGLISKAVGGRSHHVRALLAPDCQQVFQLGDDVEIAVPERVVVGGALLVYILPLLSLLVGAMLMSQWYSADAWVALGALLGLVAGLAVVRIHAWWTRNNCQLQPRVLGLNRSADSVAATTEPISFK
jgi:sigma-E factor negative regulatory protein RseC